MIVVDVETTGTVPGRHAILSIGALEFEHSDNQFYGECRISATTEVQPIALQVNGFTMEQISDPAKPTQAQLILQFQKWILHIEDKTLAGHNTGFDVGMLWAGYKVAGLKAPFGYRHIDLHTLVYIQMIKHGQPIPRAKNRTAITSDVTAAYVGLPPEPKPHHGLTGAKHEAEALSRLVFGSNLLAEYRPYPIPDFLLPVPQT